MPRAGRAIAIVRRAANTIGTGIQDVIQCAVNAIHARIRHVQNLELQRTADDKIGSGNGGGLSRLIVEEIGGDCWDYIKIRISRRHGCFSYSA